MQLRSENYKVYLEFSHEQRGNTDGRQTKMSMWLALLHHPPLSESVGKRVVRLSGPTEKPTKSNLNNLGGRA